MLTASSDMPLHGWNRSKLGLDNEPPNYRRAQAICDCGGCTELPWGRPQPHGTTAIRLAEDEAFAHRCKTDRLIGATRIEGVDWPKQATA